MSKYHEAYEAGVKAGDEARFSKHYSPSDWMGHFLCYMAKEQPGFEALYRRFAAGFDPANKRWAEGNDD